MSKLDHFGTTFSFPFPVDDHLDDIVTWIRKHVMSPFGVLFTIAMWFIWRSKNIEVFRIKLGKFGLLLVKFTIWWRKLFNPFPLLFLNPILDTLVGFPLR